MAAKRESRAPESPLDGALAAFVTSDDELRPIVRAFLVDAMNEWRYLLRHGSPPVKAKLLANLGAALVRGTTVRQEEDDDEMARRAAFEIAMREARQDIERIGGDVAGLDDVDDG